MTGRTLKLAVASNNETMIAAVQYRITSAFLAERKDVTSVEVACVDIVPPKGKICDTEELIFRAIENAEAAYLCQDATMGYGISIGEVSVPHRNIYLNRNERLVFDVAIHVGISPAGIVSWSIRNPFKIHTEAAHVRESGREIVNRIAKFRGIDTDQTLQQVHGHVTVVLGEFPLDLAIHGNVLVH